MKRYFKLLILAVISLFVVSSLAACSSAPTFEAANYAAIIDVRTPDEFATGHLSGAVNMNLNDAAFADKVSQLEKSANYFIYCHSGNRAGQAIDYMTSAGFTGILTNGGGVDSASASIGIAIVQN